MLFYPAKCGNTLNRAAWLPEQICGRVMMNPRYSWARLTVPVPAICDSGAFQDIDTGVRLLPWAALDRQLAFERQVWYDLGCDWHFEALVTYDQMLGVDEQVVNGKKTKQRGTEASACPAIAETLRAAGYYSTQRNRIAGRICFAAQGATPDQYVNECVYPMLDYMRPGDWFAFGGFCIIGAVPRYKPLFMETVDRVLPLLARRGIRRAHLLGVGVQDMVAYAAAAGRREGVAFSLDTSAIEVRSVMGSVFDGYQWAKIYTKADKDARAYHPAQLAEQNLRYYDGWAEGLTTQEPEAIAA